MILPPGPHGTCPLAHLYSFQGDGFQITWNTHIAVTWQPGTGGCSHLPCSSIILGPWALHRPGSGCPANKAPSTCLPSQLHTGLTGTTETLGNKGESTESAGWTDQGQTWTSPSPTGPSYLFPSREGHGDPEVQGGQNTVLALRGLTA